MIFLTFTPDHPLTACAPVLTLNKYTGCFAVYCIVGSINNTMATGTYYPRDSKVRIVYFSSSSILRHGSSFDPTPYICSDKCDEILSLTSSNDIIRRRNNFTPLISLRVYFDHVSDSALINAKCKLKCTQGWFMLMLILYPSFGHPIGSLKKDHDQVTRSNIFANFVQIMLCVMFLTCFRACDEGPGCYCKARKQTKSSVKLERRAQSARWRKGSRLR